MKIIEREEILRRLTPAWCIGLMRDCLSQLEEGRAVQYLRTVTPLPSGDIMGYMPAAVSGAFGAKVITVFHHNSEKGLPSHQGSVLLFDGETGTLQAMLDGGAITEIRTGAASAVATDLLAIREIRKLREVRVWSPSLESDTRFAREMGELTGLPVRICASAKEAAEGADILCTLTPSKTPVLEREWLKPGAHVNAVGACSADARELTGELVRDSVFYCDSVESVMAESGDFLIPLREGLFGEEHLRGTLGELLLGRKPGRTSPEEITVYESLGLAVEDIACAEALCRPAAKL